MFVSLVKEQQNASYDTNVTIYLMATQGLTNGNLLSLACYVTTQLSKIENVRDKVENGRAVIYTIAL